MQHILFSIENAIAKITFNRPQVFNSMHHAMRIEILEALDVCEKDPAIRAVYITGTGRAFCAGEDLQEVTDPNGPSLTEIISTGYNPMVLKIRNLEKPVVAAVNGVAAGAGANIALACDIVVATESASFTQAFSKIGLIPDSGGTWTLPRLVGFQRAFNIPGRLAAYHRHPEHFREHRLVAGDAVATDTHFNLGRDIGPGGIGRRSNPGQAGQHQQCEQFFHGGESHQ